MAANVESCIGGRYRTADAITASHTASGQIATLVVPADVAWSEGESVSALILLAPEPMPAAKSIEQAASMLRSGLPSAVLLNGNGLYGEGVAVAGRIPPLLAPDYSIRTPLPASTSAGLPIVERVAYVLEQGVEQFKDFRQLVPRVSPSRRLFRLP